MCFVQQFCGNFHITQHTGSMQGWVPPNQLEMHKKPVVRDLYVLVFPYFVTEVPGKSVEKFILPSQQQKV